MSVDVKFNPNPLHFEVSGPIQWSRVNITEAVPGVCTPLGFSFWSRPNELGVRRGYHALGLMPRSEVILPTRPEEAVLGVFYGRVAINLTVQKAPMDRMPGFSSAGSHAIMLGKGGGAEATRGAGKGFAATVRPLLRIAWCVARIPTWQAGLSRDIIPWWRHGVGAGAPQTSESAIRLLREANDRFLHIFGIHMATGFLMSAVYGQLAQLSAAAGLPGLETVLGSGYGGVDETRSLQFLWEVAHGRRAYRDFLVEHGFHGPAEGQISARSWRENPALLKGIIAEMSQRGPDESPQAAEQRQAQRRMAAERQLIAALPARRRATARLMIWLAKRLVPMRENGKACFLRTIDAGRAAARFLGEDQAARGILEAPDDLFQLTYAEITGGALGVDRGRLRATLAERKVRYLEYQQLDLPFDWVGMPTPKILDTASGDRTVTVSGQGVSPGRVEGRVQVITRPGADTSLEPGDILVCAMTDPSWASLLMLASGAVIDMGGAMSHGAVVARELGIPCIMNTVHGSKALRTGDRIRMDGTLGTIEVLERALLT